MFTRPPNMMGGAYPPQAGKAGVAMSGIPGMPGMGPGMHMGPGGKGYMGMMRPPMQGQGGGPGGGGRPQGPMPQQPQAQAQPQQQASPNQPLTAAALAAAPPAVQKQMIGEKLYPIITRMQPEIAGKIT